MAGGKGKRKRRQEDVVKRFIREVEKTIGSARREFEKADSVLGYLGFWLDQQCDVKEGQYLDGADVVKVVREKLNKGIDRLGFITRASLLVELDKACKK